MRTDVETVVIGAGAVGLAIARALAHAGHEVMVLERHARAGAETSARNSEVLHAGLYYRPGSLKARLCVEGRALLAAFAADNGVAIRHTGKLLVATGDSERPKLESIAANAGENGAVALEPLTAAAARRLEPGLVCVAAYRSPATAVIDSHGLVQALEGHVLAAGGSIVLSSEVTRLSVRPGGGFDLEVASGGSTSRLSSRHVVIAAGLGASRLGRMIEMKSGYTTPETFFAKGHYFTLAGRPPFRHLVYPMPSHGSLGIHFTLDTAGAAKFGPDIDWIKTPANEPPGYDFDDPDGERRARFETAIRRYWPGLPAGALTPGYTGIRPKLVRAGGPDGDFAIHGEAEHGIPGLVALYGIESPGLTSCLAIARLAAEKIARRDGT